MTETAWRLAVFALSVVVFVVAYRTRDLDGVKDAWMYRVSFAFWMASVPGFVATKLLRLW
jgi:hypothetical protein